MVRRRKIPSDIETHVLMSTRRRCPLCFFLDEIRDSVEGQIAHLNHNREDNNFDNLAWLCLTHHSLFDSKTSQHKNFTAKEIKNYRDRLIQAFEENAELFVSQNSIDSKFCIEPNGVTWVISCESDEPSISHSLLRIKYKIDETVRPGYLFCIRDSNEFSRVYAFFKHREDGESVNRLGIFINHPERTPQIIASFSLRKGWNELTIKVETDKIVWLQNGEKSYYYHQVDDFLISSITFGGKIDKTLTGPLKCKIESIILKDHILNRVVYKMDFSHGKEFFEETRSSSKLLYYNTSLDWLLKRD